MNPQLQDFKQNGGKGYGEFQYSSSEFCYNIYDAMTQADKIRFNLDGVDFSKVNSYNGEVSDLGKPINGNYTNYELWLIKNNPDFLNKTIFYQNGQEVPPPSYFN